MPRRIPPLLLLTLIAAVYYSLYFRYGFNIADDGSVVLLSQRILGGERPIRDLMLGYNVLWFYPISGLFALFGVNFIVARVWFFALATLTAMLVYFLLAKISDNK